MNARPDAVLARVGRPTSAIHADGRVARGFVATLVIGGYIAVGFAFGLSADAYLLLGIPITVAFQSLIVRRPLRALWLRSAPPFAFTWRSIPAVIVVAIVPAATTFRGLQQDNPVLAAYGVAALIGAVGAVYAIGKMDRNAAVATLRATLVNGAILVSVMMVYRLATGGFHGSVGEAVAAALLSAATYLPVVFVMEEVLFRGLLDPYLHGSTAGPDRATAVYGSALWGLWHLPVAAIGLGVFTVPYLVAVHTALGFILVTAWRRTGNLAAPGIGHAVSDALRNAVAVL